MRFVLPKEELKKWGWNLVKFSAPGLAVFFGQLAMGVEIKKAALVALLVFYGLVADYFKKLSESKEK